MNNVIIDALQGARIALAPLAGQDWVVALFLCGAAALVYLAARRWSS